MRKINNIYNKLSRGVKASFWFTICSLMQKGIAFIATPFYTRMLTKEQYGIYSVYQSWLGIITIFATLSLSAGVFNNILVNADRFNSDDDKSLSNIQFLEILTILFVAIIVMLINYFFPFVMNMDFKVIVMMFITIIFSSAVSLWTTKEKFRYNYFPVVIVTLLYSMLCVTVNLLLIKFGNNKNYSLIFGGTLVSSVLYLPLLIINLVKGKNYFNFRLWKYAILFNLPLLPHYLASTILSSSDKIMIENIISKEAAALYSIPYNIGTLAGIFILAINSSLVPTTYQKLKNKDYNGLDKVINISLGFIVFVAFGISILGPEAVWILGGSGYIEAKWVIPPVAASMYFNMLYPIFANVEFFYEKKWFTTISSTIAAITNIVLNAIFIPMFGYVAAAFTTLVCYGVLGLVHYISYKIICKQNNLPKLYNEKFIFVMSLCMLGLVGVTYLLYLNDIIRYIVIACVILIGLIFSKKIFIQLGKIFIKKESFGDQEVKK